MLLNVTFSLIRVDVIPRKLSSFLKLRFVIDFDLLLDAILIDELSNCRTEQVII